MSLVLIGLNHEAAPIDIRESFSLTEKEIESAAEYLLQQEGIEECFLFSTCNRTELYAFCTGEPRSLQEYLLGFFLQQKQIDPQVLNDELFYVMEEKEAAEHLLHVACGLDSMVLGETQILGQVKEAFHFCQEIKATGPYLNSLCQKAIFTGKKAHTETAIGMNAISFGYAAAELAKENFPNLHEQTLVVIGTGEMAELTLQNIFDMGIKEVIVASHYQERAKELASHFKGKTINLTEIDKGLFDADVVICATNAPHYVITAERVHLSLNPQRENPMLVIDLGVPRNVEPEVGNFKQVELYNLDDINTIIQKNLQTRRKEAKKVEGIIEEELSNFIRWYKHQQAIPFITMLREKAEKIRQDKLEQFENQLSSLSAKERRTVEKLTRSLVNRLVKDPIMNMKDLSLQDDYKIAEQYARRILGIDEIPRENKMEKEGEIIKSEKDK